MALAYLQGSAKTYVQAALLGGHLGVVPCRWRLLVLCPHVFRWLALALLKGDGLAANRLPRPGASARVRWRSARCEESLDSAIVNDGFGDAGRRRLFGKQLGEHMGTLGLCHHIPPGAIKGRCASMPPLVRPTTPTLTICAALLGVGLTIATNAKQALPCTFWPLGHRHRI